MYLSSGKLDFIGLATSYPVENGKVLPRRYLDSAASTLMMRIAHDAAEKFLQHYASIHSTTHFSAKISTTAFAWAHKKILDFVGADSDEYTSIFNGSGATGCINRVARSLSSLRPDKSVVLVSLMEHHSNDLPHRMHASVVKHIRLADNNGPVCLKDLEAQLISHNGKVNYVAVTGVSNVTGIINPIHDIAELAHRYGALVVVDGAQMAAHMPVRLKCHERPERDIDIFVFSGHKAYAPGSPGILVIKKKLLADLTPAEMGGGGGGRRV